MLYLMRHAQTAFNGKRIVCGRTDAPITDEGIAQATAVAEQIKSVKFDAVFVSPLMRTQQTAKCALSKNSFDGELIVDERLIERDFGYNEGERLDRTIGVFVDNTTGAESVYDFRMDCELVRCETLESVQERIYSFIEETAERYKGKNVLVVTHNGCVRFFRRYFGECGDATNLGPFAFDNAQIKAYEI